MHVPYQPTFNNTNYGTTQNVESTPLLLLPTVLISPSEPAPHPYGYWNTGLCDCCIYGCCHISSICALCFPRILMAQILTRLKLDICANHNGDAYKNTFRNMWIIAISYAIFNTFLSCKEPEFEVNDAQELNVTEPDCPRWQRSLNWIISTMFGLYTLFILTKLRQAVRQRYKIPTERYCCVCCCGPIEDFCCAVWCSCCTIAQLARQTADYQRDRPACCSKDGLRRTSTISNATIPALVV